jgi:hypothetical protein
VSALVLQGASDVARWCQVTRAAVSNWATRHPDDIPEPDAIIVNEGSTAAPVRGWKLDRKDEWMAFAATRLVSPGAAAVLSARRRTADLIRRQASTGQIPESVAIELLASLIGSEPAEGSTS